MNLIQIYDMDGDELGLFTHEQDKDLQPLVNSCTERANERWDSQQEEDEFGILDIFLEELENEGFQRIFVVQELTTTIL